MNLLIDEMDTVIVAAIPRVARVTAVLPVIMLATASALPFPEAYIVARGLQRAIKYNLEAVPPWAFDAWLRAAIEAAGEHEAMLTVAILGIDRSRWSVEEKWLIINELHMRGVDLPLYSPIEAEMEVQR